MQENKVVLSCQFPISNNKTIAELLSASIYQALTQFAKTANFENKQIEFEGIDLTIFNKTTDNYYDFLAKYHLRVNGQKTKMSVKTNYRPIAI